MSVPRLHQSTAHTLLSESPHHAWYFHAELGGHQRKGSAATQRGNVLDRMLFGVGPELAVIDFSDFKTKAAQAARDEAEAAGKLVVLLDTYEKHRLFVEAVNAQLAEHRIVLSGESQVEVEWISPNGDVACAGRMDHVLRHTMFRSSRLGGPLILDLKTCRKATEDAVAASIVNYGYDIQYAAYTEAARVLGWGEPEMKFVFAETTEPYALRIAPLAGTMKSLGEYKWRRACLLWKECLEKNSFPGYPVTAIEAKAWHLAQAVEDGDEAMDIHG